MDHARESVSRGIYPARLLCDVVNRLARKPILRRTSQLAA